MLGIGSDQGKGGLVGKAEQRGIRTLSKRDPVAVHPNGEGTAYLQGTRQLPVSVHVDGLAVRTGLDRLDRVGEPGVVRVGDDRVGVGETCHREHTQQNRQEHQGSPCAHGHPVRHSTSRFLSHGTRLRRNIDNQINSGLRTPRSCPTWNAPGHFTKRTR